MKIILFSIAMGLLFNGCGINDKSTIKLTCIDGKIYVDWYEASLVDSDENIEQKRYLRRDKSLYLNDNSTPIKCMAE